MPLYEKANAECYRICENMLKLYHGSLVDVGVTVDILFAKPKPDKNGETDPAAVTVKHGGYPAAAVVKVNSFKLRAQGHADAEITIDHERWTVTPEDRKDALIDHELEHLELKLDKDGNVARDDLDRPMLKLRPHDHQFGWFDSVARRHGAASYEMQQYGDFSENVAERWRRYTLEELDEIRNQIIRENGELVIGEVKPFPAAPAPLMAEVNQPEMDEAEIEEFQSVDTELNALLDG